MSCQHDDTFEDGTTRFCSDCGETVAYVSADTGAWVWGAVDSDLRWTEDGYVSRFGTSS